MLWNVTKKKKKGTFKRIMLYYVELEYFSKAFQKS